MEKQRNHLITLLLYPLHWGYSFVSYIRNRLYDYGMIRSYSFSTPVVSIGNISVGGTGKTPHIEHFVDELKDELNIAVLSRGYKRKTKGYLLVEKNHHFLDTGDEPLQIKQKFPDVTVCVDANRKRAIDKLSNELSPLPDLILMDDGFQHRKIRPGISILLIDYHQPLYEDRILPLGRLRESLHESKRANIIIITKTPEVVTPIERRILIKNLNLFPYQQLFFTRISYGEPVSFFPENHDVPIEKDFQKNPLEILLISGIARPETFREYLANQYSKMIISIVFPDHHAFQKEDFIKIKSDFDKLNSKNKVVITTEKDSVRLRNHPDLEILSGIPIYFIPISIKFVDQEKKLTRQILDYVRKNQRNNRLYQSVSETKA